MVVWFLVWVSSEPTETYKIYMIYDIKSKPMNMRFIKPAILQFLDFLGTVWYACTSPLPKVIEEQLRFIISSIHLSCSTAHYIAA